MSTTLPWFPPAPAAGPASILSLPPDDWVMQLKIDGIRVIIYKGQPFTRLGEPLSTCKGAALLACLAGVHQVACSLGLLGGTGEQGGCRNSLRRCGFRLRCADLGVMDMTKLLKGLTPPGRDARNGQERASKAIRNHVSVLPLVS